MKPIDELSDDEFAQRLRQAVALPDAPAALVHAATALWSRRTTEAAASPGALLRRVMAVLRADSQAPAPGALAMRSGRSSATRHLLFSAEGRDIDLRIIPAGGGFVLAGQVLGPDEAGDIALAAAAAPEEVLASARLDALGEFRIEGVAPGIHRLTFRLGGDEIMLPAIEFGPVAGAVEN